MSGLTIPTTAKVPKEVLVPFEVRGQLLHLARHLNAEICIEGPAGTGKTLGIAHYVHMLLRSYPGVRVLVARKTNVDLAASAMETYRKEVLQPWDNVRYFGGNKVEPPAFRYPNGSELVMTGLDKADKVKSQQFNIGWINEATEVTLTDMEFVRSRLGRDARMPFWQLLMDVNPAGPAHWLKKRMDEGRTVRLFSRHEDNPAFFDLRTGEFTPLGRNYIETNLGGLTGVRYLRLVKGIWAAAEGLVYPEWDAEKHIIPHFEIPRDWPRYMGIDWGYNNPAVVGWWATDHDGRLYCYRELYHTGMTPTDLAHEVLDVMGYEYNNGVLRARHPGADPLPRAIICDHDKSDRVTFERESGLYPVVPAHKEIDAGIKAVRHRLREAGDGRPHIFYLQGALIKRDPALMETKKPCSTIEEYDGYIWDRRSVAAENKELPEDKDNHGMDETRYVVMYFENGSEVDYVRWPF